LDRSKNYESNGIGFIIFGALGYNFLKFEFSLKPIENRKGIFIL
jgi:hypothetical protein